MSKAGLTNDQNQKFTVAAAANGRSLRQPQPLIEPGDAFRYVVCMSLAQLKDQAAHLQPIEQRELIAFLIARQTALDEDFKQTLARKIDDSDPSRWVELDELQKRYAE